MTSRSSSSAVEVAAAAVLTGVVTALLPPARLPTPVRRSMHAGLGLTAGAAVWFALSRLPESGTEEAPAAREPLPVPARLAFASAFGGLVALCSVAGGVLDARAEHALARRGSRHPRFWIGLAGAAVSVATSVRDVRRPDGVATDAGTQLP